MAHCRCGAGKGKALFASDNRDITLAEEITNAKTGGKLPASASGDKGAGKVYKTTAKAALYLIGQIRPFCVKDKLLKLIIGCELHDSNQSLM